MYDIGLVSTAMAYTCGNNASSPPDSFEEHGCLCGTDQTAFRFSQLFYIRISTEMRSVRQWHCHNDRVCLLTRKVFITESDIKENFAVRNTGVQKWNTDIMMCG